MFEPVEYFWSRVPGRFVNKTSGEHKPFCSFNGTAREWYETLVEVMIDVGLTAQQLMGPEPLRYVSWVGDPDICCILECSVLFKSFAPSREIGTIYRSTTGILSFVKEHEGTLANMPVRDEPVFQGSREMVLYQFHGTEHERVLGRVKVLDA